MKKKIAIICVLLTIALVQLYCSVGERNASASLKIMIILPDRNEGNLSTTSINSHIPSSILPPSYSPKSPIEVVDFLKNDSGLILKVKNNSNSLNSISIVIKLISKETGNILYFQNINSVQLSADKNIKMRFPSIAAYENAVIFLSLTDSYKNVKNLGLSI